MIGGREKTILAEIDKDARQTVSAIARKAGVSPELALYHLRSLEKKGVVLGYYSLNNAAALGYDLYRVFFKLGGISRTRHDDFIKHLKAHKEIGWVASCGGNFDVIAGILSRDRNRVYSVLEDITRNYGKCIRSREISINLEMWNYTRKFLDRHGKEFHFFSERAVKIDDTDKAIMRMVSADGRKPAAEIGRLMGISAKTVAYRLRNLVKSRVILGFRPVINRELIGMEYYKILLKLQQADERRLKQLMSFLRSSDNVAYIVKVLGGWEFEIELETENSRKCHDFVADIREKFPEIIDYAEVIPIFCDHKYSFSL